MQTRTGRYRVNLIHVVAKHFLVDVTVVLIMRAKNKRLTTLTANIRINKRGPLRDEKHGVPAMPRPRCERQTMRRFT